MRSIWVLVTGLLAGAALLAGCAAGTGGSRAGIEAPVAAHNEVDVRFAGAMIVHHRQAIELADLALALPAGTEVVDLAGRVKTVRQPELEQLTGWLAQWDAPAGQAAVPVADERSSALRAATGTEFDRLWLQAMIEHQRGAVELASAAVTEAADERTRTLARRVVTTQEAEVEEMRALLPQG